MDITWFYKGLTKEVDITMWMESHKYYLPSSPNDEWTDVEPFCPKYVQGIIQDDDNEFHKKTFTVSEYVLDKTVLRFPFQKPNHLFINVCVVYFANLYMHPNAMDLVVLQLEAFIKTGMLQEITNTKLHVILSVGKTDQDLVCHRLINLFEKYGLSSKLCIETTEENAHEYPGILKVYELSDGPNSIILYFHSKGVTRFQGNRDTHEISVFNIVISNWKWILFVFENFLSVDKVGVSASHYGWLWSNFWWIRSEYVKKLETPVKTDRRHYYEDWVARELPSRDCINTGGAPIYDYSTSKMLICKIQVPYLLHFDNCWNILQQPPDFLNLGTPHSDMEAVLGNV